MHELIEKKANVLKSSCQVLFRPLLLRSCPSGEIGRHRGFKIPRPQSVPVRVWPRAPSFYCRMNGVNKESSNMLVFLCLKFLDVHLMQRQPVFKLQQLQQRHPQAFYQRLCYGSVKLVGGYTNPLLHLWSLCITFLCMLIMYSLFMLIEIFIQSDNVLHSLNLSLLFFISALFPLLCRAKYQALHSSRFYARRINVSMYYCVFAAFILGINHFIFSSENLSICVFVFVCLNVIRSLWIEPLYLNDTSALQRFELQQLRKLAYWAHQEAKKAQPQPVDQVSDLQQYYLNVYQQAKYAENQLSQQIRVHSWMSFLY